MPRRDTLPELALRRELHGRGLRYRVDLAPLKSLRRRDLSDTTRLEDRLDRAAVAGRLHWTFVERTGDYSG